MVMSGDEKSAFESTRDHLNHIVYLIKSSVPINIKNKQ